jgi:endonuclease YncB( thermonuclease family)
MKQALLFTLLLAFTASAFEFTGKVGGGDTDGDTITVLAEGNKQYKVRLQHIDCPETRQPFGAKAKQFLSQKVFGKNVTVKWVATYSLGCVNNHLPMP